MSELEELRKYKENTEKFISELYRERAKCVQLLIATLTRTGFQGGIRESSIAEDNDFPVLLAVVPFIDPVTKERKEHEISWHISKNDFVIPPEDFGIIDRKWDGQPNSVTYERVDELTKIFIKSEVEILME